MNQKLPAKKNSLSIAVAIALMPLSTLAQTPPRDTSKLEEVVVTAQMRAESMQTVPVSMAAVGGDKLQEAGINKLQDLATQIPT